MAASRTTGSRLCVAVINRSEPQTDLGSAPLHHGETRASADTGKISGPRKGRGDYRPVVPTADSFEVMVGGVPCQGAIMQGLWLESGRLVVRDDLPQPLAREDEALVRVRLAGVCHTDEELVRGYAGFTGIPGHEFVGDVEVGPERLVGQRVVGEINLACGSCPECEGGRRNHCRQRRVLGIRDHHGAFAEYLTLPVMNLHVVPDSLPDDLAIFTEPLAAAVRVTEQVPVGPEHRALVLGDGKLGQLIARVLLLSGCDTTVCGRHPRKLELLAALGVSTRQAAEPTAEPYDVVVECTGSASGFSDAMRAVRPGGRLVLKSTYAGKLSLDASAVVVNEVEVIGSRCGPFTPALAALEARRVDPRPTIDAIYPLVEGREAVRHSSSRGALKVLLRPR